MEKKENRKKEIETGGISDYMWLASIGIHLVVSSVVGLFIGIYIDKWLHTKPIFMFVFFVVGLLAGFRQIYKELKKIGQNSQ
jgi:ATP synthase protein I